MRQRFIPAVETLEMRNLLSAEAHTLYRLMSVDPLSTSGPTGTTPAKIKHAYGFDQITGDGAGTTIAIVDAYDDPKISSDLHQFDVRFGLPDPVFTKVNQNGGTALPAHNGGWTVEISLDVEWAHAIAPKADILLVEANNAQLGNMYQAVRTAAGASNVVAVSMSWATGEYGSEVNDDAHTFVTPAGHTGVTFLASSGDTGAPPVYPSASPHVVSVGGTTLSLTSQGDIISETAWGGSGGGISSVEAQPAYQNGIVTQSSTRRTTPDVAYDANPNTGFPVYDSYNYGNSAPWVQVGGTSDAAPQWAALIAIADEGRINAGLLPLDGFSQTLPALYQMSSADFHDIISGTSNGNPHYSAKSGYDLVTGRGTPFANLVVNSLAIFGATGPHVTAATAVINGGVTGITLTFNETVQAASFSTADVDVLNGPNGTITPSGITQVSNTQFEVVFPTQTTVGNYTLTVGPNIIDASGRAMDQNGNGVNGEDPGDRYTTTFSLAIPASLPVDDDLADGVPHGFISQAGTWSVSGGNYNAMPFVVATDVISIIQTNALPADLEFDATVSSNPKTNGYASNAAIIFDYQGPTNFKFAIGYFGGGQWTIGHRNGGGWVADAIVNDSTISSGTPVNLQLILQGSTATLLANGTAKVSFGYSSAFTGLVGLGTQNAISQFGNIQVKPYPNSSPLPIQQNFNDGIAHDFEPQAGAGWAVTNGTYGAVPPIGADAVSLLQINGALPSEFDITMTTGAALNGYSSNGFIIFDYQSPTNFKFAGARAGAHNWVIGHRDGTGWHNDAIVSDANLKSQKTYNLQLLLQGSTATLLVGGVSKTSFNFGIGFVGSVGLGTQGSLTTFDNLVVK